MALVFYYTETSGTESRFDQICQFAAIRTTYDLEIEDAERDIVNLRCRRLPHVVPSPGVLAVTNIDPRILESENRSHYEMVREISVRLATWSPSVFCGYNSIRFDETFLRHAFYQTLHPIYLTNRNGNYRALSSQIDNFIEQQVAFYLTNLFVSGLHTEVVSFAARNANDAREVAVFNLAYEPALCPGASSTA